MDTTHSDSSAMDMTQFQGAFFEEAAEHLTAMESLLVRIDVDAPTADELNAIFRAAHSIKGGSGMFGFQDMTKLTHELESLLDRVRRHELRLRPMMVDVLLESSDLLRGQLAFYAGQGEAPVAIDTMCGRIRACIQEAVAPVTAPAAPALQAPELPKASAQRTVEITFPVSAEVEPALPDLLAQLAALGTVDDVSPPPAAVKGRARSKKAKALAQRVWRLTTETADDVVLTLFEFVMDSAQVSITAVASDGAAAVPDPASPPAASADGGAPEAAVDSDFGLFQAESKGAPETGAAPNGAPHAGAESPAPAPAARREGERPAAADSSIRVSVEKVDQLINLVGELVITQSMLAASVARLDPLTNEKLLSGMADLERNTRDLQESVMSIRMLPIAFVFSRFPRLVRDLTGKLGKQAKLVTQGEGTELDKGLIEKISDPLTHLVRNSIDHGIETSEERVAAGKPAEGTILLRAAHQGGNIIIQVADDGAGLNRERILAKARERGMAVSDTMTDTEVWNLIFEAGFSTATVVTDVSGRGVGMDVVRRNISSLGGNVEIDSALGVGTRITVRLPLTLAIMDGMSVAVGSEVYIVPLGSIVESLQVAESQVRTIAGRGRVIDVRGEFVPVVSLHDLFVNGPALGERASGTVVIVEADGGKTALLVDELLGQHQVVVKSLDSNYRKVHGISGATIMGDGRVALIIDVAPLTRNRRQSACS